MAVRERAVPAFLEAVDWFTGLVPGLSPAQLEGPGLGEWTLRQLVAHSVRALLTVEEYLRATPPGAAPQDDDPIRAAATYFLSTRDNPEVHRAVAERGRQEAERLGPDLAAAVTEASARTTDVVRRAPGDAVFETRFGTVGFATYLCTRTLELVVHGIDVCAAAGQEASVPDLPASVTLAVMAELACRRGEAVPVIRALGGRADLPEGTALFS